VTPEFVDAIDPCEVPCEGGPGMFTTSPTNKGLYCGGQMEVPTYCNPTQGFTSCGGDRCNSYGGCNTCTGGGVTIQGGSTPMWEGSTVLPGGTGYDDSTGTPTLAPAAELPQPGAPASGSPGQSTPAPATPMTPPQSGAQNSFDDLSLPVVETDQAEMPSQSPEPGNQSYHAPAMPANPFRSAADEGSPPSHTAPRAYSPQRRPVFMRNATRPYNRQAQPAQPGPQPAENGLIGPVGYDVE
jgi:hypothetical protein